jgi:Ca2+-binding RTX toxin-like protein
VTPEEFRALLVKVRNDVVLAEFANRVPQTDLQLGAFRFDSDALGLIRDVYDAFGTGASTVTAGQQALTTSLLQQLELDLVEAAAAELAAAGGSASAAVVTRLQAVALEEFNAAETADEMVLALDALRGVAALADFGLGTLTFTDASAKAATAEALLVAAGDSGFGSFAEAQAALESATGGVSASALSASEEGSAEPAGSGLVRTGEGSETNLLGTEGDDLLVGTEGNDRFLPGAGNDHLELGGGVDTVVLDGSGAGEGADTLYGFLFGPEAQGGDVLSLPSADGGLAVLADPQASLDPVALADALVASLEGALDPVTYVLAQEGTPADGVADVALARVVFDDGEASAELLVRFVDAGPSFDALELHNLPDLTGL